jgi:hypothetical protein
LSALKDDPEHVKALLRRSTANIAIGTWSTLTTAEDGARGRAFYGRSHLLLRLLILVGLVHAVDYKKLLGLLPPSSPLRAHAQQELRSLPDRIKTRAEEEKGEMLGKLKDLGNTLLGNFGLSTDKCVRHPFAFPTHQSDWLTSLRTAPGPPPSLLFLCQLQIRAERVGRLRHELRAMKMRLSRRARSAKE